VGGLVVRGKRREGKVVGSFLPVNNMEK